ncbi:MAG: response regulator [Candidatus Eisenbacteria bacterium]|nr:response regulator [Candidatus Eisenbacteria bacterium]
MSYSILVVDDSRIVRTMVKKTISMSGMDVREIYEAENGKQALDVLGKEWVDIVFADLNMPEMSGVEMVEKMSEDNLLVSIPVVIVSSEHSEKRIEELKERGIRAYIKKPFRPECFTDVVKDVLDGVGGGSDES